MFIPYAFVYTSYTVFNHEFYYHNPGELSVENSTAVTESVTMSSTVIVMENYVSV